MGAIRWTLRGAAALVLLGGLLAVAPEIHSAGAILTVDTTADILDDGHCSFQEAIQAANLNGSWSHADDCPQGSAAGADVVAFSIGGGGAQSIPLPSRVDVLGPVFLDGSTQAGYAGVPLVELSGAGQLLAFYEAAGNSTIKALKINTVNASGPAVGFYSSRNNTVLGNYFNTDGVSITGTAYGLVLNGSSDHTIGDGTAAGRNLFGGQHGIRIDDGSNNRIEGNYFGVQADGITPLTGLDRWGTGIEISSLSGESVANLIRANVITGLGSGIYIGSAPWNPKAVSHTAITGNYIGVGADGQTPLGNSYGVTIFDSSYNVIGGLAEGDRNVISGNLLANIDFNNEEGNPASNFNRIIGNYIGLDASGSSAVHPMTERGIAVGAGASNRIGGTAPGSGNIISGNRQGISIAADATGTIIRGNRIGTDKEGTYAVPNEVGIFINGSSANIGDEKTPGNNLISGNAPYSGIMIWGPSTTTVYGNRVGLNADDTGGIPNVDGIWVAGGNTSVRIVRNWIAYNSHTGVSINPSTTMHSSWGNCFTGNVQYGVYNFGTSPAPFGSNWWNHPDGPSLLKSPGRGDAVSEYVNVEPFLTAPAAGCGPAAKLSTETLDFGSQLVRTSAAHQTVTLSNPGVMTLHVATITATSPYGFSGGNCPLGGGVLEPGAGCSLEVTFTPTVPGNAPGKVTITTDAASSPNEVVLAGTGIPGTPLLNNGSFEIDSNGDNRPDAYSFTGFDAKTDKRDCTVSRTGACSLKLVGTGSPKSALQTVLKVGQAGDDFTFSLWSRALHVPAGSTYRLQVQFFAGPVWIATRTMDFPAGTHPFQMVRGTFLAPAPYSKIVFRIHLGAMSGTAWFDDASIRWAH